jgi:general secretion pathway protein E
VSTLPSIYGERVVLRLLDKHADKMDLSRLGLGSEVRAKLESLLTLPHGIFLVTGPTGSGKTTTLYAGLGTLNSREKNVLTVEDPVEYHVQGLGQTQVNNKAGMTFAKGLRAILRQDPDVVMVGEIRDLETKQIAVQASLTGHLVLSTLHTNSAAGAVTRLLDMGVESFLLSSSLSGVLAQRLVRKLCVRCKVVHSLSQTESEMFNAKLSSGDVIYKISDNGCEHCGGTGYRGRTGIYELIVVGQEIRKLMHDGASEHEIAQQARKSTQSILHDGLRKVRLGETSLSEVLRVVQEI